MNFYEIPPSLGAEIDELEKLLMRYQQGGLEATKFRAYRVPFGIYEQRKSGTYMIRIRCTAGGVTPGQLGLVARLSEQYGADYIHITTRQELQIHDVLLENVPTLLRELLKVGLATRGGGGNTVRNIIASWDAGITAGESFDVTPYAVSLTSMLIAEADSWTLPRKFKIAFSGTAEDNAHAAFNDLGFIALIRDGIRGFQVYVAGGMGSKPQIGHVLQPFIPADRIYNVAAAVKRVFDRHGNRKNKHVARLRFLWNKLGEEGFRSLYEQEYARIEKTALQGFHEIDNAHPSPAAAPERETSEAFHLWKRRYVSAQKQAGLCSVLVPVLLGNITCRNAIMLAELLHQFGDHSLRCTIDQNFRLRNIPEAYLGNVFRTVQALSELAAAPRFYGNAVACTGANTCKLGICLPRGALSAVTGKLMRSGLDMDRLGDFRLHLSGCPNTCGAHMAADLGFYGQIGRREQRMYPAYSVVAGARVGAAPRLAVRLDEINARNLPDFTEDLLKTYLAKKEKYPDFADYIDGEGQQDVRHICDKYRLVPTFAEDKNYYFDWGAEEIFSLAGRGVGECSAGLFDMIELDLNAIKKRRDALATAEGDAKEEHLYQMVISAARMLLITRGVEARSDREVFDFFIKYFIEYGLVDKGFLPLLQEANKGPSLAHLENMQNAAFALAEAVEKLYEGMDDSLKFRPETEETDDRAAKPEQEKMEREENLFKDLRGVSCPMNFVKTKLELAKIQKGQRLRIFLDDGEPIDNVPRSVAEEGHAVVELKKISNYWSVLIEKN